MTLDDIRARDAEDIKITLDSTGADWRRALWQVAADRRTLLAEVDRGLAERDALLAVAEAARHAGATWDADQSGPWRPWEVYVDDFDALRSALTRLDAMLP